MLARRFRVARRHRTSDARHRGERGERREARGERVFRAVHRAFASRSAERFFFRHTQTQQQRQRGQEVSGEVTLAISVRRCLMLFVGLFACLRNKRQLCTHRKRKNSLFFCVACRRKKKQLSVSLALVFTTHFVRDDCVVRSASRRRLAPPLLAPRSSLSPAGGAWALALALARRLLVAPRDAAWQRRRRRRPLAAPFATVCAAGAIVGVVVSIAERAAVQRCTPRCAVASGACCAVVCVAALCCFFSCADACRGGAACRYRYAGSSQGKEEQEDGREHCAAFGARDEVGQVDAWLQTEHETAASGADEARHFGEQHCAAAKVRGRVLLPGVFACLYVCVCARALCCVRRALACRARVCASREKSPRVLLRALTP